MQLLTAHAQVEASLALFSGLGEFATTILKIVIPTNPGAGLATLVFKARLLQGRRYAFTFTLFAIGNLGVLREPLLVFASALVPARIEGIFRAKVPGDR